MAARVPTMLHVHGKRQPTPELLKRTYQNELRAIGRHCDDNHYRGIGVYEVKDGFVLRGFSDPSDPDSVDAVEVPNADIQNLILKNFTAQRGAVLVPRSPLCPTGYEDLMRALGYELELNQAKSVTVQETVDSFTMTYHQLEAASEDGYVWVPRSVTLTTADIQELLDEAFRRRGGAD